MCARNPVVLELKKSLRKHREKIDELPKVERVAHSPTLAQASPLAWTKNQRAHQQALGCQRKRAC